MATGHPGRARGAVFAIFLTNGVVTGLWAGHIPVVRDRLALGEAALGLALLLIAIGAVAIMPFAGGLSARFGSRRVATLASLAFLGAATLPLLAPSYATLLVATFLFGATTGCMDVAMNTQAAAVQGALGRPIMSSCHAGYSLGAFAGAGIAAGLLALGSPPPLGVGLVCLAFAGLVVAAGRHLLAERADRISPSFVRPRGPAWLIGLLALLAFLAEGAVLDWGAIFLMESVRATEAAAAMGFAAFSLTMTVGRLTGDLVVGRLGARWVLATSGVIAAVGLGSSLVAASLPLAILGFALAGIGLANIVPILFSAGARTPGLSPALGIAMVASLGYAGILAGPALIGFAAELVGLPGALAILPVIGLVIAVVGRAGVIASTLVADAGAAQRAPAT